MLAFILISFLFDSSFSTEVDVLILGAGASGIGAASFLYQNKMKNFLILEAKDYIGGRMKAVSFAGETIELGAGWMHKANENHLFYQLALKYNLSMILTSYGDQTITYRNGETGAKYSHSVVQTRSNLLESKRRILDELIEKRIEDGRYDVSLETGLRWCGWASQTKLDDAIEYYKFDFENGIGPDRISGTAYGYTGEKNATDYVVKDPRGFFYVLEQVADPFKEKISLNTEVKAVKRISQNNFEVTVRNGSKFTSKHVLVTFSTGVLLSENVKFLPRLPAWKIEAISIAPMAHYCKIFLQFPSKFWDDTLYVMLATKVRGQFMHWQNLEQFFPNKNILLATLTGDKCLESGLKDDNVIKTEVFTVLKKVYSNAVEPTEISRYQFETDPQFLGSYSYQATGVTEDDYVALEHPVNQSLWFTGEYANGLDFGYAHGAFIHGQKTAKKIIHCLKDKVCPEHVPKRSSRTNCPSTLSSKSQLLLPSLQVLLAFLFLFGVKNF